MHLTSARCPSTTGNSDAVRRSSFFMAAGDTDVYPFDRQIAAFESQFRILIPDRSGYGHSTRVAGDMPLDFHRRAALETFSFLDALGIERAFLWGHSDGSVIAAMMGLTSAAALHRRGAGSIPLPAKKTWLARILRTILCASGGLGRRYAQTARRRSRRNALANGVAPQLWSLVSNRGQRPAPGRRSLRRPARRPPRANIVSPRKPRPSYRAGRDGPRTAGPPPRDDAIHR